MLYAVMFFFPKQYHLSASKWLLRPFRQAGPYDGIAAPPCGRSRRSSASADGDVLPVQARFDLANQAANRKKRNRRKEPCAQICRETFDALDARWSRKISSLNYHGPKPPPLSRPDRPGFCPDGSVR